MKLNHGLHLAYSTNVHRSESWAQTFDSLQKYTLAVREKICPLAPYAIGLRLSERAAVELNEPGELFNFRRWLDKNSCYIFTLNGFPYGYFHGSSAKEKAYLPDWTSPERVAYTNLLFNLLAELVPADVDGSVSTLPGSFKEFHLSTDALKTMRQNLWRTVEHIARVSEKTGRKLHLGLEPEPLCLLESSAEAIHLFEHLRAEHPRDERLDQHLGVNYDACHFAVEFEEPHNALPFLINNGIKISKIHLSSALRVYPAPDVCEELKKIPSDPFLHQVVECDESGTRQIFRDLPDALQQMAKRYQTLQAEGVQEITLPEWRIHYHVPMHAALQAPLENTNDHVLGVLDLLGEFPEICTHLEMETYHWEMLPEELKSREVVDQLTAETHWVLAQLRERGLA